KMFKHLFKKIMGKIFPHSSLRSRMGESKASIATRLRVLTEEWLPLTKLEGFGTGDIEVTLEPGVYQLIASFVLVEGSGGFVLGRFYDATNGAALSSGYTRATTLLGGGVLCQFSKIVEITSVTRIKFDLKVDET